VPPIKCLRWGWFHPWAGAGAWCPAVSRRKKLQKGMVRAEGLEPSRAVKLNGFSYRPRLSPPGRDVSGHARQVCGLDYPFTIPRKIRGLGAARLVSTPSRLECSGRAWLGIAISGFPEFGQFCITGFPSEHSSFLKSVASAGSATPAWLIIYSFYQRTAERRPQSCFKVLGGLFFPFGFGLGRMMLMAAASRLVLMWEA
jgi:hypothetical protein